MEGNEKAGSGYMDSKVSSTARWRRPWHQISIGCRLAGLPDSYVGASELYNWDIDIKHSLGLGCDFSEEVRFGEVAKGGVLAA